MTAEIRTIISGAVEFSAINREISIPIDVSRLRDLVDIEMQLYCAPAAIPLINSAQLTGGEDFRLYINEYNVTRALTEELATLLTLLDHNTLKAAYLKGAEAYIKFARAMTLPDDQVDADWEKAQEIANDEDWSSKISVLGSRRIGWSGNLHCFNFLYRFIPLKPISLNAVWTRFKDNTGQNLPNKLSDFSHLVYTLSQGGSPSYDTFNPVETLPSGRLIYQVEQLHKNPLEPRLRQIASKLKIISKQLEIQRVDYLTPIKSGVDTANEDIIKGNTEATTALDRLTNAVKQIG